MPKPICAVEDCWRLVVARGWCEPHYRSWKRYGDPLAAKLKPHGSVAERFWPKVEKDGPVPSGRPDLGRCWSWRAATDLHGYGVFAVGTHCRRAAAHRVAYGLLVSEIPAGLELDHLCRNPNCVNPVHLEPVTHRENMLRGKTVGAANAVKTHCKYGHLFDEANTHVKRSGKRDCRACGRIRAQAKRDRLRATTS